MKRFLSSALASLLLFSCTGSDKPLRTDARHDALSSGMVISEVYGGGGSNSSTYRYDFIELFNRGTTAIDVTNWSVQYASDTGAGWQVASLGSYGLVQPGSYLLVRMGTMGPAGTTLPLQDVSGGSLMSATAGKVALVSSTTALTGSCPAVGTYVDLVGYGTTASCSEGGPTAATSATTSARRNLNGCSDTDSNSQDFTVGTPTPKNSGSTSVVCTGGGGGGTDAGCTTLSTWATATTSAGYDVAKLTTFAESWTQGSTDVLVVEAYFGNGLVLPSTTTFTSASTYGACELCAVMSRGCTSPQTCAHDFFAQAGSMTVSTAAQDATAGQLTATLNGVRFDEWDFVNDAPVPGGACVVLTSQSVNASWGAGTGGGTGTGGGSGTGGGAGTGGSAGMGGGAGIGGGTATGGSTGTHDSGMAADGGTMPTRQRGSSSCGCSSGTDVLATLLGGLLVLRRRRAGH